MENRSEEGQRDPGASADAVPATDLADEDRILLVFAYLGPLGAVALWARRTAFVRWHARQGCALSVVAAALIVLVYPFHWLFSGVPFLGPLFIAAELLVGLGYLALIALAIERALAGRKFRLPWIADLADQD